MLEVWLMFNDARPHQGNMAAMSRSLKSLLNKNEYFVHYTLV